MYYFDPAGLTIPTGTQVVVETAKGLEIAQVVAGNHEVEEEKVVLPLRRSCTSAFTLFRRLR